MVVCSGAESETEAGEMENPVENAPPLPVHQIGIRDDLRQYVLHALIEECAVLYCTALFQQPRLDNQTPVRQLQVLMLQAPPLGPLAQVGFTPRCQIFNTRLTTYLANNHPSTTLVFIEESTLLHRPVTILLG